MSEEKKPKYPKYILKMFILDGIFLTYLAYLIAFTDTSGSDFTTNIFIGVVAIGVISVGLIMQESLANKRAKEE